MMLLLDRGNSRLKWALTSGDDWRSGVVESVSEIPVDAAPRRVLISSVAGKDITDLLRSEIKQQWSLTSELVATQASAYGVTNCYADCTQMGVDRWLAMVAAHACYPQGALVVNAGTALTVDTIDAAGNMLGGSIFPGPGLMLSALHQGTADIGSSDINLKLFDTHSGIETTTEQSVVAGISQGFVGAVERLISVYYKRLPADAVVLVTGGWAKSLLQNNNQAMIHESDLVLKGLAIVAGAGEK
ncbi:MAG: type III pantothenate kinase [Proteobacteria bacterium]|nr:type III pantothenate kinase [Pseudomonadota bacterium]